MKCNPLRWLWGLLPLALIALAVNWIERPRIERDLTNRTQAALQAAGYNWAETAFQRSGRDGWLVGQATDEADRGKAYALASGIPGLRSLDNKVGLVDRAEKYTWSATKLGGRVRLRGLVPSDKDRKDILGLAKASFPGLEIVDEMRLRRGVPGRDPWLGGISYSFKQLEKLKHGSTELVFVSLCRETSLQA